MGTPIRLKNSYAQDDNLWCWVDGSAIPGFQKKETWGTRTV
jgi:hypothetical protein